MAEPAMERRRSPLDALLDRFGGSAARIEPVGFRGLVNLRGRPDDGSFLRAIEKATGLALPVEANMWTGSPDNAALWLGPDEWLLVVPDGQAAAVEDAIRTERAHDPWLSVVDVSHGMTGLALSGPAARMVLAKGCPIDLHERTFSGQRCAQTVLAKSRMLLRLVDATPCFEVWVRNSFARYAALWLLDAAGEFNEDSAM